MGINKFKENHWYKYTGEMTRQRGWNREGHMDFFLDGEWHKCTYANEDRAKFEDSTAPDETWVFYAKDLANMEESKELPTHTKTGKKRKKYSIRTEIAADGENIVLSVKYSKTLNKLLDKYCVEGEKIEVTYSTGEKDTVYERPKVKSFITRAINSALIFASKRKKEEGIQIECSTMGIATDRIESMKRDIKTVLEINEKIKSAKEKTTFEVIQR